MIKKFIRKYIRNEDAATAIEYGLIAALISIVIIIALGLVGNALENVFNVIAGALEDAADTN